MWRVKRGPIEIELGYENYQQNDYERAHGGGSKSGCTSVFFPDLWCKEGLGVWGVPGFQNIEIENDQ